MTDVEVIFWSFLLGFSYSVFGDIVCRYRIHGITHDLMEQRASYWKILFWAIVVRVFWPVYYALLRRKAGR